MFTFSIRFWLLAGLSFALMSCASPQFLAEPSDGVFVAPNRLMASSAKDGIAISAQQIETPYGLYNRITTFHITIINQTDNPIEFIPREYVLFDQLQRQYFALSKLDLTEAAAAGMYAGRIHWGVGYGFHHYHYPYRHYSFYAYNPFFYSYPEPYPVSYRGLISNALPINPFKIFARATYEGNLYFPVPPKSLQQARVRITRLKERPRQSEPPVEIPYTFVFSVIQ